MSGSSKPKPKKPKTSPPPAAKKKPPKKATPPKKRGRAAAAARPARGRNAPPPEPPKKSRKPAGDKLKAAGDCPPPTPDGYQRIKDRARERNARLSRTGRDIAPIPPIADPERRARCERDLLAFLTTYFPHLFTLAWSPDHLTMIGKAQQSVLMGGLFASAMPRGSGKTTILECTCIWAGFYGHRPFVALLGPDAGHAERMLESVKVELECNELLAADFPEICHPIAMLEGIANRCAGQHCNGERTHITWTAREIVLPTIAGSKASGGVIKAAGITASIRGMKHKRADGTTIRPSLVFPDDIQTDASASSATQCATRERILSGAVLGLAGPGQKISGLLAATVLRAGDVADRLLDPTLHPEWNGERVAAMKSSPVNRKLWDDYAEIRAAGLRSGQGLAAATKFYRQHRAAMDEGCVVYWPERFNSDEISAVQNLMNLKIQDEEAFEAEYQNAPKKATRVEDLTPDQVAGRLNKLERGVVPIAAAHLVGFIDVQGTLLYWTVAGIAADMTGWIVDYGAWPEQGRSYWALRDARPTLQDRAKGAGLEGAIFAGLQHLTAALCGREWLREGGGGTARIERLLIDANWGASTDTVFQAARQSPHAAILLPSHGRYFGAAATPLSQYTPKPGERAGLNWRIGLQAGKRSIRHVTWDTNAWKTFMAARLRAAPGDRGSWSLFGDQAQVHRMMADHLTSEQAIEVEARGRKVDEWRLKPGRENHWWDCVVGCAVAGSIQGASLLAPQGPREKVSLRELQKRAKRWRPNGGGE